MSNYSCIFGFLNCIVKSEQHGCHTEKSNCACIELVSIARFIIYASILVATFIAAVFSESSVIKAYRPILSPIRGLFGVQPSVSLLRSGPSVMIAL